VQKAAGFLVKAGVALLPAPLQAVAVNAAKALMELYPVKHIHEMRLRIEGAGGSVIFNVVVPETKENGNEEKDESPVEPEND
jgi:hypothetical protein